MITQTPITAYLVPKWIANNLQILEGYVDYLAEDGFEKTVESFMAAGNMQAVGFLKDIGRRCFTHIIENGFGLTHTKLICGRCRRPFDSSKDWWYSEQGTKHFEWWHEEFESRWRHECANEHQVKELVGIGQYVYAPEGHPKGCTRCGVIHSTLTTVIKDNQRRRVCSKYLKVHISGDGLGHVFSDCHKIMKGEGFVKQ